MKPIAVLAALAGALLLALSGHGAVSQMARTIKLVVPFPAGGSGDDLARLLADQIGRTRGVNFVIEDRPGAGTVVATEAVSRAAPDGNTLLMTPIPSSSIRSLKKLNYDPFSSFAPVCHLVSFAAHRRGEQRLALSQLRRPDQGRALPGELTISIAPPPPSTSRSRCSACRRHQHDPRPLSGRTPAVTALLGGHVTAVIANYSEVEAHLAAGKLRALATASRKRIASAPNLPTIAESGYPNYDAEVWFGLVAPAKTPAEAIVQFSEWFGAALQTASVKEKLALIEMYPAGTCGADFAAYLRRQFDDYARVIREADIKAE